jgi:hypothetical protein
MLYPIQYEFLFLFTTLADPELELGAGAKTLIFRLQLRLHNTDYDSVAPFKLVLML